MSRSTALTPITDTLSLVETLQGLTSYTAEHYHLRNLLGGGRKVHEWVQGFFRAQQHTAFSNDDWYTVVCMSISCLIIKDELFSHSQVNRQPWRTTVELIPTPIFTVPLPSDGTSREIGPSVSAEIEPQILSEHGDHLAFFARMGHLMRTMVGYYLYENHYVAFSMHISSRRVISYDTDDSEILQTTTLLKPLVRIWLRKGGNESAAEEEVNEWVFEHRRLISQNDTMSCGPLVLHLIRLLADDEQAAMHGLCIPDTASEHSQSSHFRPDVTALRLAQGIAFCRNLQMVKCLYDIVEAEDGVKVIAEMLKQI